MKRLLLLGLMAILGLSVNAQLLTWTPPFPKEDDPSQTLVITMDATKGNKELLNYSPVTDVYVHIGIITNKSTSSTNWLHVPFTWGTTNAVANAPSAGTNKWKFTINGSLRSFFGVTDPTETILKIALLFRTGNGSKAQRNADGSDMYVPVYGNTLAVRIDQPGSQPKYTPVPETQNWIVGTNFSVTANASKPSDMKLYHNGTLIASQTNAQTLSANSTVTAIGNQQLVAEANDGTTTKYDTLNIFVSPASSPVVALPSGARDGINYEPGDTSVTLVLRAPGKNKVTVVGDFNNWIQDTGYIMKKTPDGKFFWLRLHPLTAGTEYAYQYVVDDTIKVADPYAEKILDPNNDQFISSSTYPNLKTYPAGQTGIVSVLQTGQTAYNWAVNNFTRPDKRGLIIYELLVRDFVAAHDWKTVMDSLSYLKKLGINAIEIMPFNEFEGNISWGYNPDFYFAPDKYYGTKSSLKVFIDSCHKKGIAVIMDIALNHSFGSSPMVQLYWDAVNNRPAANNPWFNPVPKHAFNVGFDMNHESADTKYYFGRIVEYWLQQYKIDGFRFDLSKGFTQTQTCDNNGNNCNVGNWGNPDPSRIAIWKAYYDTLQNKSTGSYAILEHFADNSEEKDLSDYGFLLWGNLNYNYSQAAEGNISNSDFSGGIYTVRNWTKPHLVTYMESHDEERIVYNALNYGNSSGGYNIKDTATALKRMELDAAFLFTIPGPKMIWQFGELGYSYSINTCENGTVSNDCRLSPKPIRWDYLNDPKRKSVYITYSSLINLRFHPWYKDAFISGTIEKTLNGAAKWIKLSSGDTSQMVVVGNFDVSTQFASVTFPSAGTWYDYLENTPFTSTGTLQTITLLPGEFHVYVNRNVNNVTATPVSNVPWNSDELNAKLYPNPVRSDFTLELNLPQNSVTRVDLYTPLGQFVTTLHDGLLIKGVHQLPIKRKAVSSGSYYVRITTKTSTKTIQVTFQ
jgi:1,4-alpha-glucan branching enzyme